MSQIPTLPLNNGTSIPVLGFGTGTASSRRHAPQQSFSPALVQTLKTALSLGIRHIDGAANYGNEEEIGVAIRESGIPRAEIFVTTKVRDLSALPGAIDGSLEKLGLSYVDLYLIHSPYAADDTEQLQKAWRHLEAIQKSGKAKSIGVSNFLRPHIESILSVASIVPAVNQIEFHPYLQRSGDYIPWLKEKGIQVTSYNGLTPLRKAAGGPLDGVLKRIAGGHGVAENAVLIRWQIERGVVPITTSGREERIREYLEGVGLRLRGEEVEEISRVGATYHFRASQVGRFEKDDRS
ncbi:Aldo/keto reductase [Hyaloscypha variabilis F]|uniref:Aldo/keto reductase n=1 Tax=Hyaloscypha variabilis (strain UAMH 11265 / GT02V1 / F) TaxID=1149755 RepID=A0A2J6RJG8_HYAVF|nr:Aldo/keto reductase [Hyaloscypha variabilis F]